MVLAKPTLHDLVYLCERARPDEAAQYEALTGLPWSPDVVAGDYLSRRGPQFVLLDWNNAPLVAAGLEFVIPGCWRAWMVGTSQAWDAHWRAITLNTNRVFRQVLRTERRIEIIALQSRAQACEWYERGLTMRREGTHPQFGVNGETAVTYARVRQGGDHGEF